MKISIDELITFCEEKEYNHRVSCKRYDDASGYTRSKDKSIRNASAIIEETHADSYREIAEILRKYEEIKEVVEDRNSKPPLTTLNRIIRVIENDKV